MISPIAGTLLIAEPFLKDVNFKRTVICLCEHTKEGSFGLILNKPLNVTLEQIIPELFGNKLKVYFGGPVQMDTIHFLHQLPNEIPGSIKIADGLYWGGDFDLVVQNIKNQKMDTQKIRFYLGYSGWETAQLDMEIKEEATWLTANSNSSIVFNNDATKTWENAVSLLGKEYRQLKNYPVDPQLN